MKKGHVVCLFVGIFVFLASCSYQAYQPHKGDISLTFQIPQYLKGEPSGSGRFIHPDANRINLIIKDGERTVVNQTKTIEGEDSVTFILENIPSAKPLGLEARVYNENNKLVGSRTTTIEPIGTNTTINISILPNEEM